MHSSQGTAHNPSQGTAQGRQAVGSWRRQGPDQPPLGVHRQHPQRKHDSADPSKTTRVQAWGCPASPRQTVSLTVKPYWWTAASRAWRLTGISKMGGDRQRGVQYRQPQAGKWIPQLPWHTTTGICLHRTVAVIMSSSSPERQQQLSVIRKYALARSATLRDLLACPRGPHHSTTAAAPTKKEKAATASLLSTLLGLRLIAVERQLDGFRALVGGAPPSPLPPKRAIKEAKMATTGPPSLTGHNLSPEGPQAISCSRHASDTVADCHVLERSLALYQRCL